MIVRGNRLVLLSLATVLGGLLCARGAAARPHDKREKSDPAAVEQSARLLGEARTALAASDAAKAQRLAAQAYRNAPTPEGLLLLGQLALADHRLLEAQDFMRRYLADPNLDAPADADGPREAQRLLERARPQAAQLNVLGDRNTVVSIDGRLVGLLPLVRPLLIAPGEHKILLERNSSRLEDQLHLSVGQLGEVRCNFATKALVLTVLPGVLIMDDSRLGEGESAPLLQLVEDTLLARRLSPIGTSDAAECSEPAPGTCADALRCEVAAAQRCEADYILRTAQRRDGPAPGTLRTVLELVDVVVGDVAARETVDCPGCTVQAALGKLKEPLESLLGRGLNRAHGALAVTTEPAGARITVDGRAVGVTPYKAELFTGPHRIEFKKESFVDSAQSVEIRENEPTQVAENLVALPPEKPIAPPPPPPPPPPLRRPLWRLVTGGVALGAAALLVGFGTSALAVDGKCVDTLSAPTSLCPSIYSTAPTGRILLGTGGALIVGGVLLIALPPRRRH